MNTHEREERDFGSGPALWDAGDVCCAAFQLGACAHTEADDEPLSWEQDVTAELRRHWDVDASNLPGFMRDAARAAAAPVFAMLPDAESVTVSVAPHGRAVQVFADGRVEAV